MELILNHHKQQQAVCIHCLDARHPLYWRTTRWKPPTYIPGCVPGTPYLEAKAAVDQWINVQDPLDLFVYTDGSWTNPNSDSAGAGWVVFWRRKHEAASTISRLPCQ